jgi:hypothetical protein
LQQHASQSSHRNFYAGPPFCAYHVRFFYNPYTSNFLLPNTLARTRDFRPPKPDPAGILHIASKWGLPDAKNLIMVGDSIDDMTAGYRAGAATVLLVNEVNAHLATHEHTDLCIKRLDELIKVLDDGFVAEVGRGEDNVDAKGMAAEALKRD